VVTRVRWSLKLQVSTFTASRAEKPSPATPPMYAHLQVFFRAGRRVDGRHGELDVLGVEVYGELPEGGGVDVDMVCRRVLDTHDQIL
jgi:hypothetical protein